MPKVPTQKSKKTPQGFEDIQERLLEFQDEMRTAELEPHLGKRKVESTWKIMKITHQRSRYIYDLYYKQKTISQELYNYLLKEKYADAILIAKWKKNGYEKLCCLACVDSGSHNFKTTCVCRVPKKQLADNKLVQCTHCGCRGCASCD